MASADQRGDPRLHIIYRGCTHPATFMGVPLVPFVLCAVFFAAPGFWLLPLGLLHAAGPWLAFMPVFVVMRVVSRKDPYALIQYSQRLRMRFRHRNKRLWGAITFSPMRYDR